jgi:hypothetical protein
VYQTLDFGDEYDETTDEEYSTDEEESIDGTDDPNENQQLNIYNHFMLEKMEDIIEWVDQHPNYKFTSIKHRFQKVKHPYYSRPKVIADSRLRWCVAGRWTGGPSLSVHPYC